MKEGADYKEITTKIVLKEGDKYLLLPGQACLGITVETIKLAPHLCGLLGKQIAEVSYCSFLRISCLCTFVFMLCILYFFVCPSCVYIFLLRAVYMC